MAHFPNTFTETVQPLTQDIGERGNAALASLQEKGFIVANGMTRYFAGAVGLMGEQPHIREYCPKDPTPARFATEDTTEAWLKKGEGRAPFLLLRQVEYKDKPMGLRLEGYGWTGTEPCEELPDHLITSAYRLGESAKGKRLSGDFVQVVVSATNALYADGEDIGLETWKSNDAARLYPKIGFQLLHAGEPEWRPTLKEVGEPGVEMIDGKPQIQDTRLYMGYPPELLAA